MSTRRHYRDEQGQTMVEFALVVPLLAVILLAVIEFGVVFHDYVTVTDAARVGARKAAVSRLAGDNGFAAEEAAKKAAENLKGPGLTARCVSANWTTPGSDVSCTVTYPYSVNLLGWVVVSGDLSSKTTERLE